jgi:hypothetical protein
VETFVNLEPNLRPADLVSIQGDVPDALERREVSAAVRDQDPLAMARLRGISGKRRILTENGGLLSAEKVGEILHNEPTGGGEAAKGGKAH